MGLPARLSELEQELLQAVAAPPPSEGAQAVAFLSDQTKQIERVLAETEPTLAEMFAEIEKSAKAVGPDSVALLDLAIEQVEAREKALAGQLLPMINAAQDLRTRTFGAAHLSREERTRAAVVLERQEKALRAILRVYRDERWRMMTLRAEVSPPGDAPVFNDARQLLEYLQANRK
jgi:hypothetical protein